MAQEDYEPQTPATEQTDPIDLDNDDNLQSPVQAGPGFGVPAPTTPCPDYRPENIHNIVETVDRYNPQNIPTLEAYIQSMQSAKTYTYDRDALLAVLKLYQFNPSYANLDVIASILTLALSALPDPDFNLCLYMLDDTQLTDPTLLRLLHTQHLLETARFKSF
ncbi:Eukaryotic translation initiation factor 3 subunit K, partial [Rhizophlyctis rosea]